MTDETKALIDSLPTHTRMSEFREYVPKDKVISLIEILTRWNMVENGLPELGVLVQTKNVSDFGGEIFYDHDKTMWYDGELMFESDQMIGARVTEWKLIN